MILPYHLFFRTLLWTIVHTAYILLATCVVHRILAKASHMVVRTLLSWKQHILLTACKSLLFWEKIPGDLLLSVIKYSHDAVENSSTFSRACLDGAQKRRSSTLRATESCH